MRTGAKNVHARPFLHTKRILEIGHVKTKLTIYLPTKKISATSERAHEHRSQKHARTVVFAYSNAF